MVKCKGVDHIMKKKDSKVHLPQNDVLTFYGFIDVKHYEIAI